MIAGVAVTRTIPKRQPITPPFRVAERKIAVRHDQPKSPEAKECADTEVHAGTQGQHQWSPALVPDKDAEEHFPRDSNVSDQVRQPWHPGHPRQIQRLIFLTRDDLPHGLSGPPCVTL